MSRRALVGTTVLIISCASCSDHANEEVERDPEQQVEPTYEPPPSSGGGPVIGGPQAGDTLWSTLVLPGEAYFFGEDFVVTGCEDHETSEIIDGLEYNFQRRCSVGTLQLSTGVLATKVVARIDAAFRSISLYPGPNGTVGISSGFEEGVALSVLNEAPYPYVRYNYARSEMRASDGTRLWELNCYSELPSNVAGAVPETRIHLYPTDQGTTYVSIVYGSILTCSNGLRESCGEPDCFKTLLLDQVGEIVREDPVTGTVLPGGGILAQTGGYPAQPVTAYSAEGEVVWSIDALTYPFRGAIAQGSFVTLTSYDSDFPSDGTIIVVNTDTGEIVTRIDGVSPIKAVAGSGYVWMAEDNEILGRVFTGYSMSDGSEVSTFWLDAGTGILVGVDPQGNPIVTIDGRAVALRGFD